MDTSEQLGILNLANEQLLRKFHQKFVALEKLVREDNAHEIVPLMMQFVDEEYPSFEQVKQRAAEIKDFLGNHQPAGI